MSRDMQIGLLLAVGFLALVGGVLYYRIEHPDELEQFLNGPETQANATNPAAPDTSKPDPPPANATPAVGSGTLLAGGNTPPTVPVQTPPPLDSTYPGVATPPPLSNPGTSVVQTAAPGTNLSKPDSKSHLLPAAVGGGAVAAGMGMMGSDKKSDDNKASAANIPDQKKADATSTTRSSLPLEPPAGTLPPPLSSSNPPTISLDLMGKNTTTPAEIKKTEEKKPAESVVKPDPLATNNTPPAATPPSLGDSSLPMPPSGGAITMSDPPKNPVTTPDKKSAELPQPPMVTPSSAGGGISFDVTKPPGAPTTGSGTGANPTTAVTSPLMSNQPPAASNPPPMTGSNPPSFSTNPPPAASGQGLSNPSTNPPLNAVITPTGPTGPPSNNASQDPQPTIDADGFRTYAPKVALGKPLAESEAALREKRWGDAAGTPAPIIPSSVDTRTTNNSSVSAPVTGPGVRAVVRDTYMPTERAMPGETFTSLSQRLYGDTNYAVALAAFNKEEGFVKMDQPTPGEWVAKPNREILDVKYPQLVRRLTPGNLNQGTMTMLASNANTKPGTVPATTTANTNLPTYRVAKGEQLFEVAKKTLGDGYRWSEIYALNKDMLRDSTELRADMVLKLPADAKK